MALVREYSDLHLDHYKLGQLWYPPERPRDKETILLLCGDLWIGTKFIEVEDILLGTGALGGHSWIDKVAARFKTVLIVLGNHDYWPCNRGLTIRNGADRCNALLQDRGLYNVHVLDRDTHLVEEESLVFVGATLWTDIDKEDPLSMHNMPNFMSYDGKIAYETGPGGQWSRFTSEKWIITHRKHVDYIRDVAKRARGHNRRVVVLTYHVPLLSLGDPRYNGHMSNGYYMSDLSDLILDNPSITHWFYGHTHHQKDTMMVNCRLINNCVGYKSENSDAAGLVNHEPIEV